MRITRSRLLAALAIQDAVAKLGDPDCRSGRSQHRDVVVQAVENSIYQTYDAAGVNVHLANAMEQMADADSILITATLMRRRSSS